MKSSNNLVYNVLTNKEVSNKYLSGTMVAWDNKFKATLMYPYLDWDLLLPTYTIDSLLSPKINNNIKQGYNLNYPLLSKNVLLSNELLTARENVKSFNNEYTNIAKKYNLGIADLNSLYKKIIEGGYVEDGVRIDPSYPNGNFFSSDGINPTPLGQAIIANEYIRTINSYFKSDIPLIRVSEYTNLK